MSGRRAARMAAKNITKLEKGLARAQQQGPPGLAPRAAAAGALLPAAARGAAGVHVPAPPVTGFEAAAAVRLAVAASAPALVGARARCRWRHARPLPPALRNARFDALQARRTRKQLEALGRSKRASKRWEAAAPTGEYGEAEAALHLYERTPKVHAVWERLLGECASMLPDFAPALGVRS